MSQLDKDRDLVSFLCLRKVTWRGVLLEDRNKLESKDGKETLKLSVFLDFFFLARELFFLFFFFFVGFLVVLCSLGLRLSLRARVHFSHIYTMWI